MIKKVIMIATLFKVLVCCINLQADNIKNKIDTLYENLLNGRNMTKIDPDSLENIFISSSTISTKISKTDRVAPKIKLILNKEVLIDKKWYKVGDFIKKYLIEDIRADGIILNNQNKRVKIYIDKNSLLGKEIETN